MDITLILVTVMSLALAGVMTVLAWRLAREERRRSEARVAALAAEIRGGPRAATDLPLRQDAPPPFDVAQGGHFDVAQARSVATSADLFAAAQPGRSGGRLGIVLAVGAIVVAAAGVLLIVGSGPARGPRTAAAHDAAAPAAAPSPLELVALTHERDGDRLTVRGLVRNPASSVAVRGVTAVVFLFNRDGGFVTSGRAPVDTTLAPGVEAPFAVTIGGAADVGRYRVSFRTDDRVLPHVDRRDRPMAQAR